MEWGTRPATPDDAAAIAAIYNEGIADRIATLVFLLSAIAGGLFGFTAMLPYIAVLALSVFVGFIVQGNFSNLTSGVLAVSAGLSLSAFFALLMLRARPTAAPAQA